MKAHCATAGCGLYPKRLKSPRMLELSQADILKKPKPVPRKKLKKNRNLLISVPFICPVPRMPPYFGRAFWKR